jgi:signal transduction histidine kinase
MRERDATVLVVDDDEAGRYAKVRLIRAAGYATVEAGSGAEALRLFEQEAPDLVLLDVKLPDIDGIEVCRRMKAAHETVAVLQTSAAFTGGVDRAAGLDSGADAYLTEPIETNELLATLRALLRLRSAEQELRRLNETLEQRVEKRTRQLAEANEHLRQEMLRREEVEAVLRQAQKMEAVGQLTGGVAHDFNNLLTVIQGNLEMIEVAKGDPARLARYVLAARRAVGRGERLTQQLLAFARRQALHPETVDLNAVIRDFAPMLRHAIGETVELALRLPDRACPADIDPAQFEAAILNLAVNARDAMPNGGRLAIETVGVTLGERELPAHPEAPAGDYCRIAVSDTGIGMAPELLTRVFEPFFTTKEIGKGTGLGLAQVYGFVTQSNGFVDLQSAPGRGTTVVLLLPRSAAAFRESSRPAAAATATGSETVLVVEDDKDVREIVVGLIEELGYCVTIAEDGREGLERLRSGEKIDLLFSDVVMPGGVSGAELAREARLMHPQLAVLLTSGYPRQTTDELGFPVIAKPYRREQLANKLRAAIAGAAKKPG